VTATRGCLINNGVPECYYNLGPLPADIYVMEADGSDAQLVVPDAGYPTFRP
jgi:hypothetical protein